MKIFIKGFVSLIIKLLLRALVYFKFGRFFYEQIIFEIVNRTKTIEHFGVKLEFSAPNSLSMWRVDSFSTKEPETLDWIDQIPNGSVLWDIGANVGLYSCYASKKKECRVFAFEPSVFNLELLARNIHLNGLEHLVTIIPIPLSDKCSISHLNMTSVSWGGAMSTFGQDYGHDGELMDTVFVTPLIGISMADAVGALAIPRPDYIKMDVDGIEHLILKGGKSILQNTVGVIIEINDKFDTQSRAADLYLREAGFELKEKRHAEEYNNVNSPAKDTYNQIWIK